MNNKYLLILLALFISACGAPVAAAPFLPAMSPQPTRTAVPTSTMVPTPTIGYMATSEYWRGVAVAQDATLVYMQSTNVAGTMQSDMLTAQSNAWTVTANSEATQSVYQTSTAAPTYVPVTMTHAANMLTADAADMTAISDHATMTAAVPTVQAAIVRSQTNEWAIPLESAARAFLMFAASVLLIALVVFVGKNWSNEKPAKVEPVIQLEDLNAEHDAYTPVALNTNPDYPSVDYLLIPCTPDELTKFTDWAINMRGSLAINQVEKAGIFVSGRVTYYEVRRFMLANHLALSAPRGDMVLTAAGEEFLRAWFEKSVPPPPYSFAPNIDTSTPNSDHVHENHIHGNGGGGASEPVGEVAVPPEPTYDA